MEDNQLETKSETKKPTFWIYQVLIVLVILYICFLLYQSLYSNFRTGEKIKSLKQDVTELQKEKGELEVLTAYYKTDTFQELEARKKLGLMMPGEKAVKVELVDKQTPVANQQKETDIQSFQVANWEKWLDFLKGIENP